MMEKMIFGRYIPVDSIIHRMDPRAKLIIVFLFIFVVFLANNSITYGILYEKGKNMTNENDAIL